MPFDNALYLALHKRRSFEHERELRAIVFGPPSDVIGVTVPVRLKDLIDSVFVAPNSPAWIHELLKKIVARYQLDVPVVHSTLEEKPLY